MSTRRPSGSFLLLLSLALGACSPDRLAGQSSCEGPAPLPPRPNEPGGFVCITNRSFGAREEEGWSTRRGNTFTIVEDKTAPVSPPYVGRAQFPVGFVGGSGPINTSAQLRGRRVRDLYMAFWLKLPEGFEGAQSAGINKVLHIWLGERSVVVFSAQGRGRNALMPQMRLQNVRADRRGVSFNLNPQREAVPLISRGRWYEVEIHLTLNSPGESNGVVEWWIDGRLAGQYRNVGFVNGGDELYWSEISWNPTWGAPKDRVAREMAMLVDHFYVSAKP